VSKARKEDKPLKKLFFPKVKDFSELFEASPDAAPEVWRFEPKRKDGYSTIGNYMTIRAPEGHRSLRVSARPVLRAWIKENMIGIDNDTFHFEAVVHDDGKTLLIVSYGLILGNRWLARVDSSTVPFKPEFSTMKIPQSKNPATAAEIRTVLKEANELLEKARSMMIYPSNTWVGNEDVHAVAMAQYAVGKAHDRLAPENRRKITR
jgi:hypothetical protein